MSTTIQRMKKSALLLLAIAALTAGCSKKSDTNTNPPPPETLAQKLAKAGQFKISSVTLTGSSGQVTVPSSDPWIVGIVFNDVVFHGNGQGQINDTADAKTIPFDYSITQDSSSDALYDLTVSYPNNDSYPFDGLTSITSSGNTITALSITETSSQTGQTFSYQSKTYSNMTLVLNAK